MLQALTLANVNLHEIGTFFLSFFWDGSEKTQISLGFLSINSFKQKPSDSTWNLMQIIFYDIKMQIADLIK